MSTIRPPIAPRAMEPPSESDIANAYGRFTADGRAYEITNWKTPRPWTNVIANPRIGLTISQTGSGFTWIDNSQLAVITRWQQEFAHDSSGKFLYVRDVDTGEVWSLAPAPVWPAYARYLCRHGLGFTTFETEFAGIEARWTLFCDVAEAVELWSVELRNLGDRPRRLELCAMLEWNCGVAPSPRREFHKLFLETRFDAAQNAVFARNHMWEVSNGQYGHWNTPFPYVSALGCTEPIESAQGDKAAFLGRGGDFRMPAALAEATWNPHFGRHEDPIAAIRSRVEIGAGESRTVGYCLAVSDSAESAERLMMTFRQPGAIERSLLGVDGLWQGMLASHRVETPDATVNFLANNWLRYQAISARLWGRAGYYQQSGAYGFRDQLQDAQVWLTIEPRRCREQIRLHARHQFSDGSVHHWWHPLTEQGHVTRMTDDLLWLAFVAANYIRETGDLGILWDAAPFLDDDREYPLVDHVLRAFGRTFSRTSPRGLPYIGGGDWNDGLSACGLQERGESIWLGQFLAGLLDDWAAIFERVAAAEAKGPARKDGGDSGFVADESSGRLRGSASSTSGAEPCWNGKLAARSEELIAEFRQRRAALVAAINKHGWDGEWYLRATLDDGSTLGGRESRVARIFLNAQVWAVLNDVAPPERARQCMSAVQRHLVRDVGALLLTPAFDAPDERIGYITRYAPGLRENGGVYTHAATWAIAAAAKMKDRELVARLLTAINPANKDPERYWAEPYVLPGNVDGPESPYFGRAGWTWYTGSAAWLPRVLTHWVLGVRPEWDGLRIDPCLPAGWARARMTRPWRGCTYEIEIEQGGTAADGVEVTLDGRRLPDNLLAPPKRIGERHSVRVRAQ